LVWVLYVGTSGWQYRDWRGAFYPREIGQEEWLEYYAERFQTVELNNSFYRLPEASTFAAWAERTPPDFVMAVKMSRFLTHIKRLKDPREPVERFFSRARRLGSKLGPVLVQLPPQLQADLPRLEGLLEVIPAGVRVALEFRHESWFTADVFEVLAGHGAALCLADGPRRRTPHWRTAEWGFVRFHEGRASPPPCYGRRALETWAERLAGLWKPDEDVFAYFNNDHRACAVRDAVVFAGLAAEAGLRPTRVPDLREVRLSV
jgi:uncharacterized protein YecE (DUF72 family)